MKIKHIERNNFIQVKVMNLYFKCILEKRYQTQSYQVI